MEDNGQSYMLWATVGSAIFGALGLLFGMYQHFSSKKEARLIFEVLQISNFDVPRELLRDIKSALISIKVRNVGNRMAENVKIDADTNSDIITRESKTHSKEISLRADNRRIECRIININPGEEFSLYLTCSGSPFDDQIQNISITHAGGIALNGRTPQHLRIPFRILGIELEYDFMNRSIRIR